MKTQVTIKVKDYRNRAEKGEVIAQYKLAMCYFEGDGVNQDQKEAVTWLRKAAEQKFPAAEYKLGDCYFQGAGIAENDTEAAHWFHKAAIQNYPIAQAMLGVCYFYGNGIDQDHQQAAHWFQQAALRNQPQALYNLGICYLYGHGVAKDELKGLDYYRQSAERGFSPAQYFLGVRHAKGDGVVKDQKTAVKWYHAAALQGHADAQYDLGHCSRLGLGVQQNQTQAVTWFEKSADQNHTLAQYHLGVCYAKGEGVYLNEKKAATSYRQAARQGYAHAQYKLGLCYAAGKGVSRDDEKAVHWFIRAAAQNHPRAAYHLGVHYSHGDGVTKNDQKAFKYYHQAAQQSHPKAQYCLGVRYVRGQTVVKDMHLAMTWMKKAADQGYLIAKHYLKEQKKTADDLKEDLSATWWEAAFLAYSGDSSLLDHLFISSKESLVRVDWNYAPPHGINKGVTLALLAAELSAKNKSELLNTLSRLPAKIRHFLDWSACAIDEKNARRGITLAWRAASLANAKKFRLLKILIHSFSYVGKYLDWNASPQHHTHSRRGVTLAWWWVSLTMKNENSALLNGFLTLPQSIFNQLNWNAVAQFRHKHRDHTLAVLTTMRSAEKGDYRLLKRMLSCPRTALKTLDWNLAPPISVKLSLSLTDWAFELGSSNEFTGLLDLLLASTEALAKINWNSSYNNSRDGTTLAWNVVETALIHDDFRMLSVLLSCPRKTFTELHWNVVCKNDDYQRVRIGESLALMAAQLALKNHPQLLNKLVDVFDDLLEPIDCNFYISNPCPHARGSLVHIAKELAIQGHCALLLELLRSPISVLKTIEWNRYNLLADILHLISSQHIDQWLLERLIRPELMSGCELHVVTNLAKIKDLRLFGNTVLLDHKNTAYFMTDNALVMKDSKPLTVLNIPVNDKLVDAKGILQKTTLECSLKIDIIKAATMKAGLNFPLLFWDDTLKAAFTALFDKNFIECDKALARLTVGNLYSLQYHFNILSAKPNLAMAHYLEFLILLKTENLDKATENKFNHHYPLRSSTAYFIMATHQTNPELSKFFYSKLIKDSPFYKLAQTRLRRLDRAPERQTSLAEAKNSGFFSSQKTTRSEAGIKPSPGN